MIVLDENILDNQRRQLNSWRIFARQIGYEIERKGMKDDEIIPFLHQLSQPTVYTRHVGLSVWHLHAEREDFLVWE